MPNLDRTKQTNETDRYTTMLEQKVGKLEEVVYGVTWDDLKAPATAINPTGSPSPATPSTTDGSLLFGASPTNVVVVWFQLPHDYVEGSNIRVHIHWAKASASPMTGTVNWQMQYKWANVGDIMPSFSSLITAEEKVANKDTAELHALASFGEVAGTGKTISSMICIYLQRTTGDTFAGDAKLFEIDIHYQRNIYSSKEEYRKVKYG